MIRWPWTNLQSLNLDWILATLKDLKQKVEDYATSVTAGAITGPEGSSANVVVTGDLDTGLDFAFTIPRGNTGATGATGPQGPEGPAGADGAVSISFTPLLNLALESSLSIAAGSSETAYTQLNPYVVDITKVIGIHKWTVASSKAKLLMIESDFVTYDGHPCFKMKLYTPTDAAISLIPASIQVSFTYYS